VPETLWGDGERVGKAEKAIDIKRDNRLHLSSLFGMEADLLRRSLGRDPVEHILPLMRTGGLLSVQALAGEEVRE
jgi:hypothetical protein